MAMTTITHHPSPPPPPPSLPQVKLQLPLLCQFTKTGEDKGTLSGQEALAAHYESVKTSSGPSDFTDLAVLSIFAFMLNVDQQVLVQKWKSTLLSKATSGSKRKVSSLPLTSTTGAAKAKKELSAEVDLADLFG